MNGLSKLPPTAIDIEMMVIAALLTDMDCYWTVNTMLSRDVFYDERHKIIYKTIEHMYRHNQKVDLVTVYQQLRVGGNIIEPTYLSHLANSTTSTANIIYHCHILIEKATARKIITECHKLMNEAYDDQADVIKLVDKLGKANEEVSAGIFGADSFIHISDLAADAVKDYYKREAAYNQGKQLGVPTGLTHLTNVMHGWQKGDLIVLAARPGMGKTAMMLLHVLTAAKAAMPVCIFSLEMSAISLTDRLVLAMADIDVDSYKTGRLDSNEINNLNIAISQVERLPIYIDPNPVVTMQYIRSKARVMKHRGQCDIIFIDYLQLCDMRTEEKGRNREQEVSATSRMAKIVAKELDVPVMLLSQLNRNVESRGVKRPTLADLRESGAIEQDADVVCFLYRPDYYATPEEKNEYAGEGEYIIAKHRDGPTGTVKWGYNKTMTDIHDYTQSNNEPEPKQIRSHHEPEEPF